MDSKRTYVLCCLVFLVLALSFAPLFFLERGTVVAWANRQRSPFLDFSFRYFIDFLGLAYIYVVPVLYYFFKSWKKAVVFIVNLCVVSVIVTILKQFIFPNELRPLSMQYKLNLSLIKGFDYHIYNSFPSGHTAVIFSVVVLFILIERLKAKAILPLICFAMVVSFSRIYLAQHFFKDVYFGMVIGFATSLLVYPVALRFINPKQQHTK